MILIDGKKAAAELRAELKEEVAGLKSKHNKVPGLTVILIGDLTPSQIYVRNKEKSANEVGLKSEVIKYPDSVEEKTVLEKIKELNGDETVSGILVQLPLPKHIDKQKVIEAIDPSKDVDGFHPMNFGKMALDMSTFIPATPFGILELLDRYNVDTKGKHTVVIGRSHIVGRPMSILMGRKGFPGNSTVTLTHSHTKNITQIISQADIVISALGVPNFLKAEMVKDDAVIIDVGITRVPDETKERGYVITGDVDYENVSKKASFITPVPGGVGPMTIAMLLKNTLLARERHRAASK